MVSDARGAMRLALGFTSDVAIPVRTPQSRSRGMSDAGMFSTS